MIKKTIPWRGLLAVFLALYQPALAVDWEGERARMADEQVEWRGVDNPRVLAAMKKVERHKFVPSDLEEYAYQDRPLPIGYRQTISQPYIVALMTELVNPGPDDRILEIGTGSGYQAAVLAELVKQVYSIEIIPQLASSAKKLLGDLGYQNVQVKQGDGFEGWPEEAPFDGIVVTAAPETIPPPLIQQLAVGGRLVIPVGEKDEQFLKVVEKLSETSLQQTRLIPVRFVPFTREED